jgi:TonB family protein
MLHLFLLGVIVFFLRGNFKYDSNDRLAFEIENVSLKENTAFSKHNVFKPQKIPKISINKHNSSKVLKQKKVDIDSSKRRKVWQTHLKKSVKKRNIKQRTNKKNLQSLKFKKRKKKETVCLKTKSIKNAFKKKLKIFRKKKKLSSKFNWKKFCSALSKRLKAKGKNLKKGGFFRENKVKGKYIPARPIKKLSPSYPTLSREKGEEGRVVFLVFINDKGKVIKIKILKSSGYPLLDKSGISVLKNTPFIQL